ncbi:hypothetical protein JCM8097_008803 [Rhodosporidiobolus ruineniae]
MQTDNQTAEIVELVDRAGGGGGEAGGRVEVETLQQPQHPPENLEAPPEAAPEEENAPLDPTHFDNDDDDDSTREPDAGCLARLGEWYHGYRRPDEVEREPRRAVAAVMEGWAKSVGEGLVTFGRWTLEHEASWMARNGAFEQTGVCGIVLYAGIALIGVYRQATGHSTVQWWHTGETLAVASLRDLLVGDFALVQLGVGAAFAASMAGTGSTLVTIVLVFLPLFLLTGLICGDYSSFRFVFFAFTGFLTLCGSARIIPYLHAKYSV